MSSETNSDTLRERLEHTQGKTRSALPWKNTAKERGNVAEDAIEYAAQLEHALKKKRGAFHQAAQAAQRRGVERDEALEALDRATQHNPPIPVTTPDKALDNIVSDELDEHGYKVGWNACLGAFRDWLREQVAGVDTDEGDGDAEP